MNKRPTMADFGMQGIQSLDALLKVPDIDGRDVDIDAIQPFPDHPFKVLDNEEMEALAESIKEGGIHTPLLLRPVGKDKYECISGHRRLFAARKAGLLKVPALIREMTDDEAVIAMVDTNMQRETILPSERAFSLRMKMDALNHRGKKTDSRDSMSEIANQKDMTRTQVYRYIRLTYLNQELLSMVDDRRLALNVGVELSYFNSGMQDLLHQYMTTVAIIKLEHLPLLRPYRERNDMTMEDILDLLKPSVSKKKAITIPEKKINKFFPAHYSQAEIENIILELLEQWNKEHIGSMD